MSIGARRMTRCDCDLCLDPSHEDRLEPFKAMASVLIAQQPERDTFGERERAMEEADG